MLEETVLEGLKRELGRDANVADIVIFGSAARTRFSRYNDIDLLVILRDHAPLQPIGLRLSSVEELRDVDFGSLFDYGTPCSLPWPKARSQYHGFYCTEDDLKKDHPIARNVVRDMISVRALPDAESRRYG